MTRDRGIGGVGQPEFLKAALPASGTIVKLGAWKEAIEQRAINFFGRQLDLDRTGQQFRAFGGQVDRVSLRTLVAKHRFFDTSRRLDQAIPLACRKLRRMTRLDDLCLGQLGDGQVHVVAAENQMATDRDPMKLNLIARVARRSHSDQCQVGCPASDVAHQNQLSGMNELSPVVAVSIDPSVKSCLRFFDQINASQPRLLGRLDRQFPCHFVERRRQRDHDVLLIERIVRMSVIPGRAQMSKVARRRGDRRHPRHVGVAMPGKKVSRSIDAIMRKPTLGRSDPASRVTLAGVASQHADTRRGRLVAALPRQARTGTGGLARREFVVKRRQRFSRFELAEIDPLRNPKRLDTTSPACSVSTKHIAQFVVPRSIPTTNREAVSDSFVRRLGWFRQNVVSCYESFRSELLAGEVTDPLLARSRILNSIFH